MHLLRKALGVVVGAAVIATGVITSAAPANAQLHAGAGFLDSARVDNVMVDVASRSIAEAFGQGADCSWRIQRVWDGFGWRNQRVRLCD